MIVNIGGSQSEDRCTASSNHYLCRDQNQHVHPVPWVVVNAPIPQRVAVDFTNVFFCVVDGNTPVHCIFFGNKMRQRKKERSKTHEEKPRCDPYRNVTSSSQVTDKNNCHKGSKFIGSCNKSRYGTPDFKSFFDRCKHTVQITRRQSSRDGQ